MAGLVSIAAAKRHLRIETVDDEADIQLKVEQASAIVLDYLKPRSIAIETISVANPTVITTSVPHSLTNGAPATITGTTTTPTVNGSQVVTVTGPTTFTVPVNVTVGQTAAAGSIGRSDWTASTVPGPIQSAVLLLLTHLYEHRGDDPATDEALWSAVERLVIRFRDPAFA